MIANHMDLSPETIDYLGAYYACRQLQADMWNQLQPARELPAFIKDHHPAWSHGHEPTIKIGPLHPQLRLLRDVTITVPVPTDRYGMCCQKALAALYSLYLSSLTVVMTGRISSGVLPNGDMKSWPPVYFMNFVVDGRVNCRKVVFSLDEMASEDGGRDRTTRIANILPGTKILCVLDITQNKEGKQTERAYSSDVRFRPLEALKG
jgi:hypothetical protein